jgi:KipI family sensor histidine kinase inhibitor
VAAAALHPVGDRIRQRVMSRVRRIIRLGPDAVLVEVADAVEAASLAAWCRERRLALDVVSGARTVLLDGLAGSEPPELSGWEPTERPPGRLVEVPVRFDGADLAEVARLWGADPVEVLTGRELTVAFCGFAPGFAYLTGLPEGLETPRLATPRPRVPAGSFAVAGEYAGFYPTASPGGWRLLGTTDAVLWDAGRPRPALLVPADRVRVVTT